MTSKKHFTIGVRLTINKASVEHQENYRQVIRRLYWSANPVNKIVITSHFNTNDNQLPSIDVG